MALISQRDDPAGLAPPTLFRLHPLRGRGWRLVMAGAAAATGGNLIVGGAASAADWVILPSIAFQEVGIDNVYQTQSNKRADAITQLIPGISITEDGPNHNLFFTYAPIVSVDASQSGQDRVDQNLLSNGKLSLIDEVLTMDFSAFATQGSGSGASVSSAASNLVPLNDRTLNYGGTIAPHLHERFGDVASLDAYYKVSSSNTTGGVQVVNEGNRLSAGLIQQDAKVLVGSGDSFNNLSLQLDLDHAVGSGSGSSNSFDNDTDLLRVTYHINHEYALVGYGGYQRIHYDSSPSFPGYDNHGLVWSAGVRITPSDSTIIELMYSKQSGAYAPEASIKYDLSPRTHIYVNYTVSIQNQLQQNLSYLANLAGNAVGAPININTGLNFNNSNNQLFGSQNVLFREKSTTLSLIRQFTRSSITIVAGNEQRQTLSSATSSDSSWYSSVTYQRELTPSLQGYADVSYSLRAFSGPLQRENDTLVNGDVSLAYQINPTITATATYSIFSRNSNVLGFNSTTNQFMIGIRKVF